MNDLPILPMEFTALFFTGLAFGAGICSVSCLPLISACILGNSRKGSDGFFAMLSFTMGKLLTAALLGAFCAAVGKTLMEKFSPEFFGYASGLLTILAGLFLLLRPACSSCEGKKPRQTSPFLLGLASPLTPCLPYAAMMAMAALAGSIPKGTALALVFTLGTSLSPLILVAIAMGWVGAGMARKMPLHIRGFSRFAGVLVMLFGLRVFFLGFGVA